MRAGPRFSCVPVTRAPGRVNLIGDHTDYQDGWCLPVAINREVRIAWSARADDQLDVASVDVPDGDVQFARLVAASREALDQRGRRSVGIDARIRSTLLIGAGLSSSAAVEVALALTLATAARLDLSRRELALAAQEIEQRATGVPCGVMDQMASVFGVAGHALLLDCRTLDVTPVALPESVELLVVHSGQARRLQTSAYAERRAACVAAAGRLGLASLRDANLADVRDDPLARHVVSENARVLAFVDALRSGDVHGAGALMNASHASLRDDFRVSTRALDTLVEQLRHEGAHGARLTGAGFGGCAIALMPAGRAAPVADSLAGRYRAFPVRAVTGARVE